MAHSTVCGKNRINRIPTVNLVKVKHKVPGRECPRAKRLQRRNHRKAAACTGDTLKAAHLARF